MSKEEYLHEVHQALCEQLRAKRREVDNLTKLCHDKDKRIANLVDIRIRDQEETRGLASRIKELEEALRFYADEDNWIEQVSGGIKLVSVVEQDDGETARDALSREPSEAPEKEE